MNELLHIAREGNWVKAGIATKISMDRRKPLHPCEYVVLAFCVKTKELHQVRDAFQCFHQR